MALLKSLKTETKTISFRLPAAVVSELEAVKSEAKAAGFSLDITDQVEKLIVAAVKQARAELAPASSGG